MSLKAHLMNGAQIDLTISDEGKLMSKNNHQHELLENLYQQAELQSTSPVEQTKCEVNSLQQISNGQLSPLCALLIVDYILKNFDVGDINGTSIGAPDAPVSLLREPGANAQHEVNTNSQPMALEINIRQSRVAEEVQEITDNAYFSKLAELRRRK